MSLVHRALYTWFITLVFLIMLVLRLESKTVLNWFLIFLPLWIYDAVLIIYICIKVISKWRRLARLKEVLTEYQWYIGAVILKTIIQVLICLKMEYPQLEISIFVVMCPIWILLCTSIVYVFYRLISVK